VGESGCAKRRLSDFGFAKILHPPDLRRAEICSAHPEDTHPAKTRDKLGIGRHIRIVRHKADSPQADRAFGGPAYGGKFISVNVL
jgi:hypothetical protein